MANPTPWPETEKQTLKEMWATNSSGTIAKILGRTRNAVIGMSRRMNLPPKSPAGGGYHPKLGMVRKSPSTPKPEVIHKPIEEGPVSLMQAKPHHCRSVLDLKDKDGLAMVCGKRIVEGQVFSFCSYHLKQYTTKGYAR